MTLVWQPLPERSNKFDCVAETPRGRYVIKRTMMGHYPSYVLRFNGDKLGVFSMADAKAHAVKHAQKEFVQ